MNLRQMTKEKNTMRNATSRPSTRGGLDTKATLYRIKPFGLGGSGRGLIDILSEEIR